MLVLFVSPANEPAFLLHGQGPSALPPPRPEALPSLAGPPLKHTEILSNPKTYQLLIMCCLSCVCQPAPEASLAVAVRYTACRTSGNGTGMATSCPPRTASASPSEAERMPLIPLSSFSVSSESVAWTANGVFYVLLMCCCFVCVCCLLFRPKSGLQILTQSLNCTGAGCPADARARVAYSPPSQRGPRL